MMEDMGIYKSLAFKVELILGPNDDLEWALEKIQEFIIEAVDPIALRIPVDEVEECENVYFDPEAEEPVKA